MTHTRTGHRLARASKLGDARGTYLYGLCTLRGVGVARDEPAGFELLRSAAAAGLPRAQVNPAVYALCALVQKGPFYV